ncbi:MAG: hemolysin III family protein [Alphaproteobacteria bacterium]
MVERIDSFPQYSRSERIADGALHVAGIAFAVLAGAALLLLAWPGETGRLIALALYVVGLAAGLTFSALYNLVEAPRAKAVLRRLDHAAIFVMIAGTYTPFAALAIGGLAGTVLLAFVWSVALAGAALKLVLDRRFDRLSTVVYLLLGWSLIPVLGPLIDGLSIGGLALLIAGGALFSLGVVFHHWQRLPFQNAIWHALVLAGAICHYLAVLRDLATAA